MQIREHIKAMMATRKQFPAIPLGRLKALYDEYGANLELFHTALALEQMEMQTQIETLDGVMRATEARVRLNDMHHRLAVGVPQGLCLEHTQALLVYGMMQLGAGRVYSSANAIPFHHIHDNVRRKLTNKFRYTLLRESFDYLIRNGVLHRKSWASHSDNVVSLNLVERSPDVTDSGRATIRAVNAFLHETWALA
jgi:hypothetical protein